MKRYLLPRLPGTALFVALCLAVWCVPWLHELAHLQLNGPSILGVFSEEEDLSHLDTNLSQRFPNDLDMQASLAEQTGDRIDKDEDDGDGEIMPPMASKAPSGPPSDPNLGLHLSKMAAYDTLMERFPNQPWLIAAYLRWAMNEAPTLPKKDREAAVALAQLGQKLEPRNSFFDWALVCLRSGGHNPAAALYSIREGASKQHYDDHTYDSIAALVKAHRLIGPVFPEEIFILAENGAIRDSPPVETVLNPIAGAIKNVGPSQFLRINNDLAHIGEQMQRGRNSLSTADSGIDLQSIAWSPWPSATPAFYSLGSPTLGALAPYEHQFAAYAVAHGRPDIAQETHRLATVALAWQKRASSHNFREFSRLPSMPILMTIWTLDEACLIQIGLLLALSTAFSVLLIATRPPPIGRRDQIISLICTAMVMLAGACGCFRYHLADIVIYYDTFSSPNYFSHTALCLLCIATFTFSPPIVGALFCGGTTGLRLWRNRAALTAQANAEFDPATHELLPRDMRPVILNVAGACYGAILVVCIIAFVIALTTHAKSWTWPVPGQAPLVIRDPNVVFGVSALCLTLFCYCGWIVAWRWLASKHRRPYTHYGLRWYRQTVSVSILISAFAYIAIALIALPYRHAADREFDQLCRRGQLATMGFPDVK